MREQSRCLFRTRALHNREGYGIRRFVAERNAQSQRQQQRKYKYPEHDFRFTLQFQHARAEQVRISGPAAVASRWVVLRRLSGGYWRFLSNTHSLFLKPQLSDKSHTANFSVNHSSANNRSVTAASTRSGTRAALPSERPRVLKLSVLLTDHEFAIALSNCQRWDSLIQRYRELSNQISVLLFVQSQVDMHDFIAGCNHGSEIGPL